MLHIIFNIKPFNIFLRTFNVLINRNTTLLKIKKLSFADKNMDSVHTGTLLYCHGSTLNFPPASMYMYTNKGESVSGTVGEQNTVFLWAWAEDMLILVVDIQDELMNREH